MGNKINHVPDEVVSIITLAGAITFVLSTYMIMNGKHLYKFLEPFLSVFERKNIHEIELNKDQLKNHVILVGANRMGEHIMEALQTNSHKLVVVDFDPEVFKRLSGKVDCVYGDIADTDIQDRAGLEHAHIIVSTVPDVEDNLLILESLKRRNKKAIVVVSAMEKIDAMDLYKAGADYVVMPHLAGGRHVAKIIVDKNHLELIESYKARDLKAF